MAERKIGRYFGAGFLGAVLLLAAYLFFPNPFVSSVILEDSPREAPIVVDSANQCKSETVYVTAMQVGYSDFEIVDERCSALQRELVDAAGEGNVERVRQLLRDGANVNSPGWPTIGGNGLVPAWSRAIWSKQTDVVKLLLDNGVDVNSSFSCCIDHSSMLMVAIAARDIDTAKLLIARGADLSFVGDFGWGVMDLAENSENREIQAFALAACNSDPGCRVRTRARRIGYSIGFLEKF
ncbi:MAG TPA: ankyrin repeat domain-containing protein [Pyrinomonadaceae bacterium]|nr:ankyrin repeat domain-containing protein [Pyrinomonadaceae bacterium]